jgi:hypothetical protein
MPATLPDTSFLRIICASNQCCDICSFGSGARRTSASALNRKLEKLNAAVAARNTFSVIANEYVANLETREMADQTISKNRWLLVDLCAALRDRPIAEIKPVEILDLLKKVEASGRSDTAHRLRSIIGAVFRYAVATLRAENDPTYALRGALLKVKTRHRPGDHRRK